MIRMHVRLGWTEMSCVWINIGKLVEGKGTGISRSYLDSVNEIPPATTTSSVDTPSNDYLYLLNLIFYFINFSFKK